MGGGGVKDECLTKKSGSRGIGPKRMGFCVNGLPVLAHGASADEARGRGGGLPPRFSPALGSGQAFPPVLETEPLAGGSKGVAVTRRWRSTTHHSQKGCRSFSATKAPLCEVWVWESARGAPRVEGEHAAYEGRDTPAAAVKGAPRWTLGWHLSHSIWRIVGGHRAGGRG